MTAAASFPFSDLALARRLEGTERQSNAKFVEARARLSPERGARWLEVAGTYAMYDGRTSPLTQTFGLGMFQPVTASDMETIERFYERLQAPVFHEVSPLADAGALELLTERDYRPVEFSSVMYRPIGPQVDPEAGRDGRLGVRIVDDHEQDVWARTAARGWSEFGPELMEFLLEVGQVNAAWDGMTSFLAERDGQPVAASALFLGDGVALLAGASTVPEGRRQGAQRALLDARLRHAAGRGCDIAMMCAQPGSASQRNAERHGFRIAYTRVKWQSARRG